nr:Chain Z, Peptide from EAEC T6SS Sci1 SciI protein [synthetic construct]
KKWDSVYASLFEKINLKK